MYPVAPLQIGGPFSYLPNDAASQLLLPSHLCPASLPPGPSANAWTPTVASRSPPSQVSSEIRSSQSKYFFYFNGRIRVSLNFLSLGRENRQNMMTGQQPRTEIAPSAKSIELDHDDEPLARLKNVHKQKHTSPSPVSHGQKDNAAGDRAGASPVGHFSSSLSNEKEASALHDGLRQNIGFPGFNQDLLASYFAGGVDRGYAFLNSSQRQPPMSLPSQFLGERAVSHGPDFFDSNPNIQSSSFAASYTVSPTPVSQLSGEAVSGVKTSCYTRESTAMAAMKDDASDLSDWVSRTASRVPSASSLSEEETAQVFARTQALSMLRHLQHLQELQRLGLLSSLMQQSRTPSPAQTSQPPGQVPPSHPPLHHRSLDGKPPLPISPNALYAQAVPQAIAKGWGSKE